MNSLSDVLKSRRANAYSGMLLATIWGLFAYAHLSAFQKTHELELLLIVVSETLMAGFFIFRSDPKTISMIPSDWVMALAGSFAPLFFRPAEWGVFPLASITMVAGMILQIVSLISLNRSFAIVAAKREIKTAWMYRIVRHPIYASYFLIFGSYLLTYTTLANLLIYIMTMILLCIRIFREERHLSLDPVYRDYMLAVRYRIIPFVF